MGKWSKYKRKYCTEWEKEPEFKDWIQKIITDETKVFCKYCHCEIRAHRTDLTAHGKTRKHHRNASPFSYMRTLFDAGSHQQDVPVLKPVMNVVELQLPVELALQTQDYFKELIGDVSEKSGHTVGIMDLETTVKKIIPPLTSSLHKGQVGRIGIIGGCQEYTGAPYFAAISALKVGADLSHVFCTKDAAPVIKSYSPELIVHPILDHPTALEEFDKWLPRIHTLVVGPGLGRDPKVFETVASVIVNSKARGIPLVIDADGLFLITESPHLISKYQNTLLTPNIMEFQRLFEKMVGDRPSQSDEMSNVKVLAQCLGNVTILQKGCEDIISDGISVIKCSTEGSPRRCGGQGDLLSGASGVFLNWALSYYNNRRKEPSTEPAEIHIGAGVIAGFMACRLTRECSRLAYTVHGRSMTTTEMIGNIHTAFEVVFCT